MKADITLNNYSLNNILRLPNDNQLSICKKQQKWSGEKSRRKEKRIYIINPQRAKERKGKKTMNTMVFIRELANKKDISAQKAYQYINSVMDTIRQILSEGNELAIGSFGKFTVMTDLLEIRR